MKRFPYLPALWNYMDGGIKILPSLQPLSWILGNVTRIPRHELPQTLDFSDFLPLFT